MDQRNYLALEVQDTVTGFKGIVDHVALYMSGCRRLCVQPKMKDDGTIPECRFIDEFQVKILNEVPAVTPAALAKQEFEFGQEVVNTVTKFKGTITGVVWHLNGCIRYEVTSPIDDTKKDGFGNEKEKWYYGNVLEAVGTKKPVKETTRKTGGVCSGTSQMKTTL